jgi:two-component system, cell cycle response regulator DivK
MLQTSGPVPGPLIVITDDDADSRDGYCEYLRYSGFDAVPAAAAAEGIQKAFALAPAVIVMDLHMPGMSGLAAIQQLRADPRTVRLPIIACSGTSQQEGSRQARAAGADVYLEKPCLPQQLVAAIRQLIATRAPAAPAPIAGA